MLKSHQKAPSASTGGRDMPHTPIALVGFAPATNQQYLYAFYDLHRI